MKKKYIQPITQMHNVEVHHMLCESIGTDDNGGEGYQAGGDGNPILGKEDLGDDFGW